MTEGTHLSDSELAGFVDNRLGPSARRAAVAHLDACEDCRAEVIEVGRLRNEASTLPLVRKTTHRSLRRPLVWTAALAAGLAGVLLFRGVPGPGEPVPTVRTPVAGSVDAQPRITAVIPRDGASLQGGAIRAFTWRAYDADNYRFLLLAEDGTPLWTFDTHDTSLVLPPEVTLAPGRTYFWRVDAHAAGITASTGTMRLQVAR